MSNHHAEARPILPRIIRVLAVPIVLLWLAIAVVSNVAVPQLEQVGEDHAVSLSPTDAPSFKAMQRIGKDFKQFDSNSSAMIVLEGDQPLGETAHHFYDALMGKLAADPKHVEHIQNFWGDPLTSAAAQSADGKAAYVQLYLAGNQGESLANESVEAVRAIVSSTPPPPGLRVYVTGSSALMADQQHAGDKSLQLITALTIVIILTMLLVIYRSVMTVGLVLFMVFVEFAAARGIIATLGYYELIGLSTFAVNLLTMLAIAAGTDYAIFLVGRYHEARRSGEDRETAFYTMYHGTAHVITGSGLTIATATFCLHFTRLPYFQSLGIPLSIGMIVTVIAALTMAPALIAAGSRIGLFEPKRIQRTRGWRRIGTAVVRWPGPILAVSLAIALVGLAALPTYRPAYNDRDYLPSDIPANEGMAAADRHFAQARMNPELLLLESDHDLRNSADMLVIEQVAKSIFHIPGLARVQTITRPLGTPMEHSSIPYTIGMQGTTQQLNQDYTDNTTANSLKQANDMAGTIASMERMQTTMTKMATIMHTMVHLMKGMTADIGDLRDRISDFDDFLRPVRNYLYWEPHCFDIPVCASLRSIFDTIDGIDTMTDDVDALVPVMTQLDALMPEMTSMMPPMIATMKRMQTYMLTQYQSQRSQQEQQKAMQDKGNVMGQAFDTAKNDESFYLPPEVFDNPDFKRGMKMFVSPDGKAVQFIISHQGNPASQEGISHIDLIRNAAFEAIKGTPLEGSRIYLAGTASMYKDMQQGSDYDLMIAGLASLALIFIIMLIMTRSVLAAAVIVGTVALSLGTSFGLSVLIWQNLLGLQLHWMVLAMSVIILLAVGSDYNLLLVSRFKEEMHAGIKTGIIRSMAGTGSVVTSAGLVFAFTMMSMVFSDLRMIGQIGSTIGLGLLVDTLVIRSFMTPALATLLGRWFWWPQNVRTRPWPSSWPRTDVPTRQPVMPG